MAVPNTNVSFSSIQTEFGGTNPISFSEYYAGGTFVPAGTQSPTDPSPIPSSGTIRVGEFRGTTAVTFLPGASVFQTNGPTFTTNCFITLQSNGTISHGGGGGATSTIYTGPATWITPASTGIGSSYQIIVDSLTGTIGSPVGPTVGVWSGFSATFSASSGPGQACSGLFACRIRNASTLAVMASFNIQVDTDNT